ncbi:MAG: Rpn family recombination-promoting nuclease/putative transposase [Bacteroides sp.]|nr:Rpn family recombination-promoting nuclease/putative transposase [Bacteroides sp.]
MDKKEEKLIRFDWAIKRLLRHKVDHSVLNGFLTSLLGKPIRILHLLESESNREDADNKHNRVDILAEEANGSKIIIEVQNESEDSYFSRMLYGSSKLISEYLKRGEDYDNVSKVYNINIVYFNLGKGNDYVYRGITEFRGIHNNELLELPDRLRSKYHVDSVSELFPEYYILKVSEFDRWSSTPIDQWMYFLSTSTIPDGSDAPGLAEARRQLRISSLTPEQRRAYFEHLDSLASMKNIVNDAHADGIWEGVKIGREEGREEGIAEGLRIGEEKGREEGIEEGRMQERLSIADSMLKAGMSPEQVATITGLDLSLLNKGKPQQ